MQLKHAEYISATLSQYKISMLRCLATHRIQSLKVAQLTLLVPEHYHLCIYCSQINGYLRYLHIPLSMHTYRMYAPITDSTYTDTDWWKLYEAYTLLYILLPAFLLLLFSKIGCCSWSWLVLLCWGKIVWCSLILN